MESQLSESNPKAVVHHTLGQLSGGCADLILWNEEVESIDDYLSSPLGMQKLAANCMLIEAIGEGIKKIDKLMPTFCSNHRPDIDWRSLKGMRDRIAHGYFEIDSDYVFDTVKNEIPTLKKALEELRDILEKEI